MKYTNADLSKLVPFKHGGFITTVGPDGLYSNVPRNSINHWLLFALTRVYNEIAHGVSISEAPFTLESLRACSEVQLNQLFNNLSPVPFWSDVDHDVKAQFLYNLYTNFSSIASPEGLKHVIAYCLNDYDIDVMTTITAPHNFDVQIDANIETLGNYEKFSARIVEYITNFVPISERITNIVVNEAQNNINCVARMVSTESFETTNIILLTDTIYIS